MRLMQNSSRDTRVRYRERLAPNLWLLVTVALSGPVVSLIFVPVNATVALVIGVLTSVLLLWAFIASAPVVTVEGTTLRAGRAHIDVTHLGTPIALQGEDSRRARGSELPARGWHLIRAGIDGIVRIPNLDPADPVDVWTISSRTPDRLAAAIEAAHPQH